MIPPAGTADRSRPAARGSPVRFGAAQSDAIRVDGRSGRTLPRGRSWRRARQAPQQAAGGAAGGYVSPGRVPIWAVDSARLHCTHGGMVGAEVIFFWELEDRPGAHRRVRRMAHHAAPALQMAGSVGVAGPLGCAVVQPERDAIRPITEHKNTAADEPVCRGRSFAKGIIVDGSRRVPTAASSLGAFRSGRKSSRVDDGRAGSRRRLPSLARRTYGRCCMRPFFCPSPRAAHPPAARSAAPAGSTRHRCR